MGCLVFMLRLANSKLIFYRPFRALCEYISGGEAGRRPRSGRERGRRGGRGGEQGASGGRLIIEILISTQSKILELMNKLVSLFISYLILGRAWESWSLDGVEMLFFCK